MCAALQQNWARVQEAAVEKDSQQLQLHQRVDTFTREYQTLAAFLDEAEASQASLTNIPSTVADLDQATRTHKVGSTL